MRTVVLFLTLAVVAGAARADESDPAGTSALSIEVGNTALVTELPGSNVLCDDLGVAAPEYSAAGDAILVRGINPGSTLCGVWLGNRKPGGLYRVVVVAAAASAPDAGAARTDGGPAPALGDAGLPDGSVPRAPGPGGSLP